ncbi:uncharacterized protein K452DRAFT_275794 [Aplosporella prunicola CBS 121167]|uniref:Ketoreductase domain-containing protein n=1 Tax=Aplosporella prunicola CBS 121167 TaxID=1176127 RepID=A0A6A6B776_9PEZI|nr:uncharacterized protein K452DRAFT_275794 [Aplosporella prunicola CBS 121167]KAF2139468.1 hypothetical protein K452DRAFT_275794 [Aplosporella prunicola CBS 121167]
MATNSSETITLITGANRGIGLAAATRLAQEHNHHVIIGARSASDGADTAATLQAAGHRASSLALDLDSDESIAAAVQAIETQFGRLDVLVNNAGVLAEPEPGLSTRERFARTLGTNVTGTACLTEALLPLLRKSQAPQVIFVSSTLGSLAENARKESPAYQWDVKAYAASKAAVNMLALNYARVLMNAGVRVNTVCPGLVKTRMNGFNPAAVSTDEGAQRIVELATMGEEAPTATFSDRSGPVPW